MKNVLLVHGFNGKPQIFNYFKEELENKGYNIIVPDFPVRQEITVKEYFNVFDEYKNIFGEDLIVIAHSIGNPMLIKYISKNQFKVGQYISLAGFAKDFYNEGKDVLNEKVKLTILTKKEIEDAKKLVKVRQSIYSNDDHIVPLNLLEEFCEELDSKGYLIENIGHMGKKSGLEKLPKVIELINE